jgi:predicted amidohydrolase
LVRPDGSLDGPYDKIFLLLFGEYVPFYDQLRIKRWIPEASNFARGSGVRLFEVGDLRIAPMICYEDIIPSFGRRLADLRPNLLVNMTNDAWFGATSEPWEHLALAVFRSVEHRLDMVRAVNSYQIQWNRNLSVDINFRTFETLVLQRRFNPWYYAASHDSRPGGQHERANRNRTGDGSDPTGP